MRQFYRDNCVLLLVGLLVVPGYVVGLSPGSAQEQEQGGAEPRKVAANVNGKPIYEEQLKPQVEASLQAFRRYGMRKENPDLVKRLQEKALKKIIDEELIRQESAKLTIEDVDEKVEQRLKAIERRYGAGERFENYFKMRNLTLEEAKEAFRAKVRVDEYLRRQGVLEPEIPEDRIREAYDRDQGSFSRDESLRVSHVLIGVDPHAGAEEKKQARQKAEDVRKQVASGEDFAEMAKKHSTCNSGPGGGDLGYIKRGYMPAPFDEAASALEANAVSEVVETKFGYHVIKLIDKKPAGVVPYEEVKGFITKYLQQEESKKKLADHLAELRKQAKIEILLPE